MLTTLYTLFHFKLISPYKEGAIIIVPIFHMGKLRLTEVRCPAQTKQW